ncbi:MAG: excinuclease ABC subunit UvrC, partial [Caulobacterales bacterium]|nr:excinuclease ABC subunit UvrC [Caulobacterales bacterium]
GPFASAGAVNRTLNTLQKAFLLRSCSDSVYENRTRPCMLHQIKRCCAPCVDYVSEAEYGALVDDAVAFLGGKSDELRARLQSEMETAAEDLEFETAARLRDRIRALAPITTSQGINPEGLVEADVIAVHMEGGQSCVQAFFFRAGQNWGDRAFFPRHDKSSEPEAVLSAFLGQFYDDKPAPRLILVSHEPPDAALLEEALSMRAERKVELRAPQRGEKAKLVAQARRNAEEALARRMAESSAQARLLDGVKDAFDLEARPERIEIYDNSHIQGAKAVGAMVVAGPEGFDKRSYRTFNIKSDDLAPGDDYAMMREVMRRRFSRLLKEMSDEDSAASPLPPEGSAHGVDGSGARADAEERPKADADEAAHESGDEAPHPLDPSLPQAGKGEATPPLSRGRKPDAWPDLVLIDGGRGQLSSVMETLAELGLGPDDVAVVAISKGPDRNAGREQFHRPNRPSFQLEPRSPVLYYLQRLRDEAHRFAIGTHRARRKKDVSDNPLDAIPGVGPGRKKALLRHFGSARAVRRAAVEDLARVEGVSKQLAKKIHDWFQG